MLLVRGGGVICEAIRQAKRRGPRCPLFLDGYEITKKGDPVRALSACTVANFIGTVPSMIVAMVACPLIASIAIKLGPWEFFALALCAIAMIASLSTGNLFKGLAAAALGILIKCIGSAPLCGTQRFTFGSYYLAGGVSLNCMMLGTFAATTILLEYARHGERPLQCRGLRSGQKQFQASRRVWQGLH